MQQNRINALAFAIILAGSGVLLTPTASPAQSTAAKCGSCEGLCCGTNPDGTCWASDVCVVPE